MLLTDTKATSFRYNINFPSDWIPQISDQSVKLVLCHRFPQELDDINGCISVYLEQNKELSIVACAIMEPHRFCTFIFQCKRQRSIGAIEDRRKIFLGSHTNLLGLRSKTPLEGYFVFLMRASCAKTSSAAVFERILEDASRNSRLRLPA